MKQPLLTVEHRLAISEVDRLVKELERYRWCRKNDLNPATAVWYARKIKELELRLHSPNPRRVAVRSSQRKCASLAHKLQHLKSKRVKLSFAMLNSHPARHGKIRDRMRRLDRSMYFCNAFLDRHADRIMRA